jgi:hypothetical protein
MTFVSKRSTGELEEVIGRACVVQRMSGSIGRSIVNGQTTLRACEDLGLDL